MRKVILTNDTHAEKLDSANAEVYITGMVVDAENNGLPNTEVNVFVNKRKVNKVTTNDAGLIKVSQIVKDYTGGPIQVKLEDIMTSTSSKIKLLFEDKPRSITKDMGRKQERSLSLPPRKKSELQKLHDEYSSIIGAFQGVKEQINKAILSSHPHNQAHYNQLLSKSLDSLTTLYKLIHTQGAFIMTSKPYEMIKENIVKNMTLQELPTYVSMVEEICKDEEKRLKSLLHSIHPEVLVQLGVREESIKHLSIVNIKQVLQIKSININHTYSGVANFLEECGDLQSIILRHGKGINLNHLNKLEKLSLESCEQISMEKILSIKYLFIKQCDRSLLQFNTAVEIDELHIGPYSVNWLGEDRVLKNVKKIYFTGLDQMYNTRIRQMVKESAEKTFPQAEIFNDRVPLI